MPEVQRRRRAVTAFDSRRHIHQTARFALQVHGAVLAGISFEVNGSDHGTQRKTSACPLFIGRNPVVDKEQIVGIVFNFYLAPAALQRVVANTAIAHQT